MATFKLIQVSDTHLSRQRPFFVSNWDAVVAHVNAAQPDLVLNSGDIALNGENVPDDLAFSAEQHGRLTVPVRTIPGNHDIGDNPSPGSHGAGIVAAQVNATIKRDAVIRREERGGELRDGIPQLSTLSTCAAASTTS